MDKKRLKHDVALTQQQFFIGAELVPSHANDIIQQDSNNTGNNNNGNDLNHDDGKYPYFLPWDVLILNPGSIAHLMAVGSTPEADVRAYQSALADTSNKNSLIIIDNLFVQYYERFASCEP